MAYLVVLLWLEEVPHGLHPLLQEAPPLAFRGAVGRGRGMRRCEQTTNRGPSSNGLLLSPPCRRFTTRPGDRARVWAA